MLSITINTKMKVIFRLKESCLSANKNWESLNQLNNTSTTTQSCRKRMNVSNLSSEQRFLCWTHCWRGRSWRLNSCRVKLCSSSVNAINYWNWQVICRFIIQCRSRFPQLVLLLSNSLSLGMSEMMRLMSCNGGLVTTSTSCRSLCHRTSRKLKWRVSM